MSRLEAASEAYVRRWAARRAIRSAIARRLGAFFGAIESWTLPEHLQQLPCRFEEKQNKNVRSPMTSAR